MHLAMHIFLTVISNSLGKKEMPELGKAPDSQWFIYNYH